MSSNKFIFTLDFETSQKLDALGFQKIESGVKGIYAFINNATLKFDNADIDMSKLRYSNILTF